MSRIALIFAALAFAVALAVPSPAAAASCPSDPFVRVAAERVTLTAGETAPYSYELCHNTAGDRYTVEVVEVVGGAEQPVVMPRTERLSGQPGTASGSGSFVPARAGRYKVLVHYYRVGQGAWEMRGEVVLRVSSAPVVTPTPTPTVPPVTPTPTPTQPPMTPTPTQPPVVTPDPTAEPVGDPGPVLPGPTATPTADKPAKPIGEPGPVRAKLRLSKRAAASRVVAGEKVAFRLTVRNVAENTARGVRVCDRIPADTQYVRASTRVRFVGSQACVAVGILKPGQRRSFSLTLSVDRGTRGRVRNTATATADNARGVRAADTVAVIPSKPERVHAPVTG